MYEWLGNVAGRRVAEIGVWKGDGAQTIIDRVDPELLVLIDQWLKVDDPTNRSKMDNSKEEIDEVYLNVCRRFIDEPRVVVLRRNSMQGALFCEGLGLDWVYIDACHTFDAVLNDAHHWGHVLTPSRYDRCFIAGHDYNGQHTGVKTAIDTLTTVHSDMFQLVALTQDFPMSYALEVLP